MLPDAHSTPDAGDAPRPFAGHAGKITAIEYSPDGRHIATASKDATVRLWDPLTGQELQKLDTTYRAEDSVQWFPDGRHFISSSMCDDYIRTWDTETGEQVREYFFRGGSCIALSPDGTLLAAGSACYSGSVIFFNTKTGDEHVHSLDGPSRACRRVLFSPNGSTLAIVLDDAYEKNLCIVFNVLGDCKTVFVQHTSKVLDVAFSPNGEQFSYTTTDDDIPICSTSS
ncbi:WD40 repeat-like protein, partial [Coniophora puteana RWD-64-598 SS2]